MSSCFLCKNFIMIEWREKEHDADDMGSMEDLRKPIRLCHFSLLNFLRNQSVKAQLLLLDKIFQRWDLMHHSLKYITLW